MADDLAHQAIIEYIFRDSDGWFFVDVVVDREPYAILGPFVSAAVRQRAHDDLLETMRSFGARDLPVFRQ